MEDTIEYGTDTKMSAIIRVRCTPEMKERIERYAKRTIGDPSDHVRKAIEEYLDDRDPQMMAPGKVSVDALMAKAAGGGKTMTGMEA